MNVSGMSKRGQHQRKRVYKGIKGRRPDLKVLRKKSADERKLAYDKLTTQQKLDRLNVAGFAAKKQRARLQALLQVEFVTAEQKVQQKKKAHKS